MTSVTGTRTGARAVRQDLLSPLLLRPEMLLEEPFPVGLEPQVTEELGRVAFGDVEQGTQHVVVLDEPCAVSLRVLASFPHAHPGRSREAVEHAFHSTPADGPGEGLPRELSPREAVGTCSVTEQEFAIWLTAGCGAIGLVTGCWTARSSSASLLALLVGFLLGAAWAVALGGRIWCFVCGPCFIGVGGPLLVTHCVSSAVAVSIRACVRRRQLEALLREGENAPPPDGFSGCPEAGHLGP